MVKEYIHVRIHNLLHNIRFILLEGTSEHIKRILLLTCPAVLFHLGPPGKTCP